MVFKRKLSRAYKPKAKRARKTRTIPRVRMSDRPMAFKRTFYDRNVIPSTGTTAGFWQYQLTNFAQLPNVAEYAALFDQYKINGIKMTFRPRYDAFDGSNTTDTTLPGITNQGKTYVHVINDPASRVIPSGTYTSTNLNVFLEQGSVKTHSGNRPFSVYYKPMIDNQNAVGTARVRAGWLPTDTTNVSHYGFHYFLQDVNLTGTFNQSWDVFTTFYFQCKGAK